MKNLSLEKMRNFRHDFRKIPCMYTKLLEFMKKNYKSILLILFLAGALVSFIEYKHFKQQQNLKKDQTILSSMMYVLINYHYKPVTVDDRFSENLFNEFIKNVDPSKRYFLQQDIDSLSKYKFDLDNQILEARFDFFNQAFDILKMRQKEAEKIFRDIIDKPLNLNEKDSIIFDYEMLKFPADYREKYNRWKQYIKYSVLTDIYQEKDSEKNDSIQKTNSEYKKQGIEVTRKNFNNFFENLSDLNKNDYLAMYFNNIAELFDPHTNYFKPADKERFDMDMSGSFEGIGARLQKEGAYTKIVELIPGGPAWKDGKLEVGDLILKVRQENEEEALDVVGMRIDEIVKKIRGKKGTTVYLTVKKLNGTIVEIPIVRDKVVLEETFAKSLILQDSIYKIGYIYLPKFYHNFENEEDRNSASDLKREIQKLEKNNTHGIIIDLRNNGGGSLADVIDIAGYFIPKGPIVQVKGRSGKINIYKDHDDAFQYNKPVVILVNELSASASEILAAALQDYKRAVVIGGNQTYGKGTVQKFVDLNQITRENSMGNLGSIKWTTQKFYRISGESTQKRGVIPDINLPDRYKYLKFGEKDRDHALPYDTIEPARYQKWEGYSNYDQVISTLKKQTDTMKIFIYLDSLAYYFKQNNERKIYPLQSSEFERLMNQNKETANRLDSLTQYSNRLKIQIVPEDSLNHAQDTLFFEKRRKWMENLRKDPYLEQAVRAVEMLRLKN